MSKLITELKEEHKNIEKVFIELQKNGATTEKGIKLIIASKQMVFEHLEKENKQLYPFLREKAKSDPMLKKTLETFSKDMESIADAIQIFYKKYSFSIENHDEFLQDMIKTKMSLKKRIMNEEIILYKAYEQLSKN